MGINLVMNKRKGCEIEDMRGREILYEETLSLKSFPLFDCPLSIPCLLLLPFKLDIIKYFPSVIVQQKSILIQNLSIFYIAPCILFFQFNF